MGDAAGRGDLGTGVDAVEPPERGEHDDPRLAARLSRSRSSDCAPRHEQQLLSTVEEVELTERLEELGDVGLHERFEPRGGSLHPKAYERPRLKVGLHQEVCARVRASEQRQVRKVESAGRAILHDDHERLARRGGFAAAHVSVERRAGGKQGGGPRFPTIRSALPMTGTQQALEE